MNMIRIFKGFCGRLIDAFGILLCLLPLHLTAAEPAEAIFASGCFWCTEKDFSEVPGVSNVVSGYIGGRTENPTYKQVSAGKTGHTEAVKVTYDPSKVTYKELLKVFWFSVDPYTKDRQFCDKGSQYRSGIFYVNKEQQGLAKESLAQLKRQFSITQPIHTEITAASQFWEAESYHQDYYKKNSFRYNYYRFSCGRDQRLKALWGDLAGWKPALDQDAAKSK